MPQVSIITPLYNGGAHIEENIASVAAQSFGDYEHLIIDNNSSDDGPEKVRAAAAADSRIRLLSNLVPGAGPTRNVGIDTAEGRYIAFLDCDDSWRPEKLERQLVDMEKRKLALSWAGYAIHGPDGALSQTQRASSSMSIDDLLSKRKVIGCLTAIYDTALVGKHYMNHLPMRQDFCLWLDILRFAEKAGLAVGGLDEVLADYRAGGMSSNKVKAARMQWRAYREHAGLSIPETIIKFHLYAIRGVASRLINKSRT